MKLLMHSQTSTLQRWSLRMDKLFYPTLYNGRNYLCILEIKLNHVDKRSPDTGKYLLKMNANIIFWSKILLYAYCWFTPSQWVCTSHLRCCVTEAYQIPTFCPQTRPADVTRCTNGTRVYLGLHKPSQQGTYMLCTRNVLFLKRKGK